MREEKLAQFKLQTKIFMYLLFDIDNSSFYKVVASKKYTNPAQRQRDTNFSKHNFLHIVPNKKYVLECFDTQIFTYRPTNATAALHNTNTVL